MGRLLGRGGKKSFFSYEKPDAWTQQENGVFDSFSAQLKSMAYPSSIPWKNAILARSGSLPELIREALPKRAMSCTVRVKKTFPVCWREYRKDFLNKFKKQHEVFEALEKKE